MPSYYIAFEMYKSIICFTLISRDLGFTSIYHLQLCTVIYPMVVNGVVDTTIFQVYDKTSFKVMNNTYCTVVSLSVKTLSYFGFYKINFAHRFRT